MAKFNPFIPSLNAGEFSKHIESRIDFAKYPNGAKRLRNCHLLPQGGFYRRPGFRYVANTKSDGAAIIVPFIFDATDAYALEVGDNYMRFFRRQAQITVADTNASITNGSFGSDISSWDDLSTGSASIAHDATNNALSLTGSAGDIAWAEQDVSHTSGGTLHVLRFKARATPGLFVKVQVGSTSGGDQFFSETALGIGYGNDADDKYSVHTVEFTPTSTPFYVQFKNDNNLLGVAEDILIDDVEILDNVPLEISTPWASSELTDLKYQQAGDVIYFQHPDHPVFKLERRGNRTWSLVQVPWNDGPWGEINPDSDLIDRQLNPNPDLLTGMDGWDNPGSANDARILYDGDQQIIELQPNSDGSDATAEIEVPTGFRQGTSTTYVAHFLIVGSFEGTGVQGTEVRVGTTSGATDIVAAADFEPGWHTISYTTAAATNHFFRFRADRNSATGGVGGLFVYAEDALLLEPSGTTGEITVDALGFSPFDSSDIGRGIRFEFPGREPGWGIIKSVATASQVTLQVRRTLPRALPTESWRLGAWSDRTGYPETMAFFEGRSVLANNATERRTLWFSQSQDIENMRADSFVEGGNTVQDDDAMVFTLTSPSAADVRWLSALRQLLIGTLGGPWVSESSGAVLTPSDRTFRQQSSVKISALRPVLVGNTVIFVDQARRRLFDLGFQFEPDAYVAADITSLAEHVSKVQIAGITYQEDPDPIIWMHRDVDNDSDGQVYTLAYNREENIVGWTRHELGGSWSGGANGKAAVNSIAIIPGSNDATQVFESGDRDEVWIVSTRTVNSSTVRFIEVAEGDYDAPDREDYATESAWIDAVQADQQNAFYVDAGISYTGASTTTITGLDHLEGETVKVLNGGQVEADKTVSSGQITLTNASGGNKVHVGLGYTSEFESLKLHYGARGGTGVGKPKAITSVTMSVIDTGKFSIGTVDYDNRSGRVVNTLEEVDFSRTGSSFTDTTLMSLERVQSLHKGNFSTDARLWITTSEPLPMKIAGLGPNMDFHESQATR